MNVPEGAVSYRVNNGTGPIAQTKATDEEIDNKVFDLYGLTEEERKLVVEA